MRKLLSLLLAAGFLTQVMAQTNPAPQVLPFEFTAQTGSQLPAGIAVHRFGTSTAAIPVTRTTSPANGDLINVTVANSGGWRAEGANGIGILASGSQSAGALVASINTTGVKNIRVGWTVRTILQQAARDNSIALQYRVGNTGNFINAGTGTTYSSSGKANGDNQSFSEFLPQEAENQPEVQVRWIYWESVSTSGSRDRLAVDDIAITADNSGDTEAPVVGSLTPASAGTGIIPSTRPVIQFSEAVLPHEGTITLKDLTRGVTFSFPVSAPEVLFDGSKLTLNVSLKPLRQYAIEVPAGLVKDAAGNLFGGISNWTFTTGEQQLAFDFNDCSGNSLPGGFTQYSAAGALTWACTTFGQTGSALQINGFRQENEDWLISPSFDLTGFDYALLTYATRSAFAGPGLQLKVSTDYSGTGNPANATWTDLKGRFPSSGSDVWTRTEDINLTGFKAENVYLAFVYTSGAGTNEASRWTLDDFQIKKSATPPAPGFTFGPAELDFDYVPSGSRSESQMISVLGYNLQSDLTLTAPDGFEVSADNEQFGKTAVLDQQAAEGNVVPVYVRFTPSAAHTEYAGVLNIGGPAWNKPATRLAGTSLRALKVVNWNIEWFGSPEQDPSNDALQQQNVQTILKKLNADIYALSEVVDTTRFKAVVAALPGYEYVVSDFGSYTDDVNDPDYATAQKLAFIYRSDVVKKLEAYGVLRSGGSNEAFRNWSSGRYPYLMKADVMLEGVATTVNLVLLHGKANTGTTSEKVDSWHRRKNGAAELKDTLDKYFPFDNLLILGDFNDDLDQTIAPSIPGNVSSYIDFLNDSTDYKPISLPLSLSGLKSTVSNDNVIDHQMASNEMGIAYVPGSVKVLTAVANWVSSYGSTTTDHYPIVARYDLRFFENPIDHKNFNGEVDRSHVNFNWITSHEINSGYFVVERSRNGKDFEPVDSVTGTGDSRTGTAYELTISKPWPGQSHYRLRSVSLDGTVTYSPVITINMKSNSHLLQVNTDNRTEAVMVYQTEVSEPAVVQLYDGNGRIYFEERMSFAKGRNIRRIVTAQLPAGIYFLRVVRGKETATEKIFIGK